MKRGSAMSSEEEPVGLKIGEKFFGLLIIFIGFVIFYFAYTSYSALSSIVPNLPTIVPGAFLFASVTIIVIGVLFIIAKEEEE